MALTPLEEVLSRLPIQGGTTSIVGTASNYANYLPVLNANGQLDSSFFANTIQHIYTPANQAARLALVANVGDIAIQQDNGSIYMYSAVSTWTVLGVTGGVPYTNTHTGLTATNVQAAIDELWDKTVATNIARTVTATVTFNTNSAPFAVSNTSGALVTNLNADLLDGYHLDHILDVANLTTGALGNSRIDPSLVAGQTYTITVNGKANSATVADSATTATTALACSGNAASADTSAACTGNAATATLATNATNLQAADATYQSGSYFQNPAHLIGGFIPSSVFDDASHGALTSPTLHALATTTAHGFMSASDKAKLDTIAASSTEPTFAFAGISIDGVPSLAATSYFDTLDFHSTNNILTITPNTNSGKSLYFDVNLGTLSHSTLANLVYSNSPTNTIIADDHLQYVTVTGQPRIISVIHTFNPALSSNPPFYVGANATGQFVAGLNADQLDGQDGAYYLNATNINAGHLGPDRLTANATYPIIAAGLSGNPTLTGNVTVGNLIDTGLIGTGNRLVYASSTGTLSTDPVILAGLINAIVVSANSDLTTAIVGNTLALTINTSGPSSANTIVKRDSNGAIYINALYISTASAASVMHLRSDDGNYYSASLHTTGGVTSWAFVADS